MFPYPLFPFTHIHNNTTEASDPLAATLENVPYVPLLANTPKAALVDLVAFANGQTGVEALPCLSQTQLTNI